MTLAQPARKAPLAQMEHKVPLVLKAHKDHREKRDHRDRRERKVILALPVKMVLMARKALPVKKESRVNLGPKAKPVRQDPKDPKESKA